MVHVASQTLVSADGQLVHQLGHKVRRPANDECLVKKNTHQHKGKFLYSAVSNPQDCSKRFYTLLPWQTCSVRHLVLFKTFPGYLSNTFKTNFNDRCNFNYNNSHARHIISISSHITVIAFKVTDQCTHTSFLYIGFPDINIQKAK